jgi:hypothetical protein
VKVSHLHSINKRLTAHQGVVTVVPEHRHLVERVHTELQRPCEPVRDHHDVAAIDSAEPETSVPAARDRL